MTTTTATTTATTTTTATPPQSARLESSNPPSSLPLSRVHGSLIRAFQSGRWFPGAWDIRDVPQRQQEQQQQSRRRQQQRRQTQGHHGSRHDSSNSRRVPQRSARRSLSGELYSTTLGTSTTRIRERRSWRRRIFLLVTEPDTSLLSALFFVALIVAIMLMNGLMMLQTMEFLQYTPTDCVFCGGDVTYMFDPDDHVDLSIVHDDDNDDLLSSSSLLSSTDSAERTSTDNRRRRFRRPNDIPCLCPPTPFAWTDQVLKYLVYFFSIEWILRVVCYTPAPHERLLVDTTTHQQQQQEERIPTTTTTIPRSGTVSQQQQQQVHRLSRRRRLRAWQHSVGQFLNYLFAWPQVLDFWATFPYYMEFLGNSNGLMSLRLLRLFRVFQLVRLGTYNTTLTTLLRVLQKATMHLKLLLLILLFAAALFGSIIFWLEKGIWQYWPKTLSYQFIRMNEHGQEEVSPFTSIPATFYWFMVTATTVGYGDVYPTSNVGRWVGVLAMLTGVLVIAFPVGVFSDLWSKELKKHMTTRHMTTRQQQQLSSSSSSSFYSQDDNDDDNDNDSDDDNDQRNYSTTRNDKSSLSSYRNPNSMVHTNINQSQTTMMTATISEEEEDEAAGAARATMAPVDTNQHWNDRRPSFSRNDGGWWDSFFFSGHDNINNNNNNSATTTTSSNSNNNSGVVVMERSDLDMLIWHFQSIQQSQIQIQKVLNKYNNHNHNVSSVIPPFLSSSSSSPPPPQGYNNHDDDHEQLEPTSTRQ